MKKILLVGLVVLSAVCVKADMPYDSVVSIANSDNSYTVATTNMGADPISISSISAQLAYPYTGTATVHFVREGIATNLLCKLVLVANTSFLITQGETDGIWLKKLDYVKIFAGTNANVVVNRKETH